METITLNPQYIMISANAKSLSKEDKGMLLQYRHDVEMELDGSCVNIILDGKTLFRLGEDEWMPLHQC